MTIIAAITIDMTIDIIIMNSIAVMMMMVVLPYFLVIALYIDILHYTRHNAMCDIVLIRSTTQGHCGREISISMRGQYPLLHVSLDNSTFVLFVVATYYRTQICILFYSTHRTVGSNV